MDTVSPATRSRIMRAIKGRNTKPERALVRQLRREKPASVFVSTARTRLPGRPDLLVHCAWDAAKLAVFVHGCFWHVCRRHHKMPGTRTAAWREHFARNVRRDRRVRRQLRALGWKTMVVWEHEDAARATRRVLRRLGWGTSSGTRTTRG